MGLVLLRCTQCSAGKREQLVSLVGDLFHGGLWRCPIASEKAVIAVSQLERSSGVADLRRFMSPWLGRLRQGFQLVRRRVNATSLGFSRERCRAMCRPEPERAVADGEHRNSHAAALGIAE